MHTYSVLLPNKTILKLNKINRGRYLVFVLGLEVQEVEEENDVIGVEILTTGEVQIDMAGMNIVARGAQTVDGNQTGTVTDTSLIETDIVRIVPMIDLQIKNLKMQKKNM